VLAELAHGLLDHELFGANSVQPARDFDSFLYPQLRSIYLPSKMSADTISNPQPAGESKSARKKREKAEAAAATAAEAAGQTQQDSDGQKTPDAADTNGDAFESSYVKELQKYIAFLINFIYRQC
jgi:hypothetical protein